MQLLYNKMTNVYITFYTRFILCESLLRLGSKNYKYKSTSANELKLCWEAIGSIRAIIFSHASKTAAPYISELAEAAVGEEFGTYFCSKHANAIAIYHQKQ